jgi:hypothetical protein
MSPLTTTPLSSLVGGGIFGLTLACSTPAQAGFFDFVSSSGETFHRLSKKDAANYEDAGNRWGERHRKLGAVPGTVSDTILVNALIDSTEGGLDFFWIHADLKDAFKKGYRMGYQDRTADLVLGPYLTEAAAMIGGNSASNFVEVVNGEPLRE